MTFLIGVTRYRHGAESFSKHDVHGDPPAKVADMAVFQLIREPASPFSPTWGHSLLMDLYGDAERVEGRATLANAANTADLVQITATSVSYGTLRQHDDYYAGNVLSIYDGNGPAVSVRAVAYDYSGGTPIFLVERPERPVGSSIRFLVNGKPFNGQGYGFNPTSGLTDLADASNSADGLILEYSLLPHFASYLGSHRRRAFPRRVAGRRRRRKLRCRQRTKHVPGHGYADRRDVARYHAFVPPAVSG